MIKKIPLQFYYNAFKNVVEPQNILSFQFLWFEISQAIDLVSDIPKIHTKNKLYNSSIIYLDV